MAWERGTTLNIVFSVTDSKCFAQSLADENNIR